MTNPFQSPESSCPFADPPKRSGKTLRRIGHLFIVLGILGLLGGPLWTVWGMTQAFNKIGQSPAPRSQVSASDIAASISTALIATACGMAVAAVFLPLGIALSIRARRAGSDYQSSGFNSSTSPG